MWKKIKIHESEYVVKRNTLGTQHQIYLTNFIHLWFEDILEKDLLDRCKDLNKLIEASDEVFLDHVWSLLGSDSCVGNEVTRDVSDTENGKILTFQANFDGFKFRMKFMMTLATAMLFYKEVTEPLLTVVTELENRKKLLVNIIQSKDVEIEEYKLEGGQISRKTVETKPFDLDAFSVQCEGQIGISKGLVDARPLNTLTPVVQTLLEKIAVAPLITSEETVVMPKENKNRTFVKLRSPNKNKKQKLYEDDDGSDNRESEEEKSRQTAKPKNRSHRVLKNL